MKFIRKLFTGVFLIWSLTFFYCEYIIYYLVIYQCNWPDSSDDYDPSMIKSMFLADTHLLGPFTGHWFDKLRREWQMYRSFQTAIHVYKPDVVFFLGDLFDEGQWCDDLKFQEYINRFFSLFKVPNNTELYVVPGNHDLGFHYVIRPYLVDKFESTFNTSSVQFLNLKGNYFVLINSMAMEGDSCFFCTEARKQLRRIANKLKCIKKGVCSRIKNHNYSRPIVLQHFPMYRKSDDNCKETDEAPPDIKDDLFKEKWDCLSKKASEMIYDELNPRAIFTGHTHHGCHTIHRNDIHEYTLSSFSWRNKNNPTFILAKITPNKYSLKKCDLPKETTVIFLYISFSFFSFIWIFHMTKNYFKSKEKYSDNNDNNKKKYI